MKNKNQDIQVVRPEKELVKGSITAQKKIISELFTCFKSTLYFLVPCWVFILLQSLSLITKEIGDLGSQIFAVAIFILGIPLSIALRVDQLSLELGTQYPREVVLFIASLLTGLNLTIILYLRKLILGFKIETKS